MKNLKTFILLGSAVLISACTNATPSDEPISQEPTSTPTTETNQESETQRIATYPMEEVAKHDNESDCWLVIGNDIYDVTDFISEHPGGDEILKGCGTDATALFISEREHQGSEAQDLLPTLKIGELGQ